ncbi:MULTISPECIES: tRNA lysidine(34) synthetase TilS [Synechococcaceae]|uniref:tRNA lysidine(34) synthetase TilS n=1 Tax=Synechococcaceae TaxID=1890426 RepID=UPI001F1F2B4B|nr:MULTISPECIES: tRNA lysidine(34) synthetase TilS [Synechococcaceae]MCT4364799.1 tRNA lysidine(34) synthetase TilS [Candidatus Regnicoccus frigidus MAG-AL1]MCT4366701.1 tRNA lysidine(34) synthetase TilS [Candidatus Regnicoccus frigidus MAG-AL2]
MAAILPPESTPAQTSPRHPGPGWGPLHRRLHRQLLADPFLLPRGERLLVAVSGGQDSMALIRLLLDLRRLHHWELRLWHGNHGWRPEAAAQAEALADWAGSLGLQVQQDQAQPPPSSEAAARDWRYAQLEHWAAELDCGHVVTGHTASDRAETVLLNLARGADRRGLSSLRRRRRLGESRWLVRPLLSLSREETADFCAAWELPVWIDSSNASPRFSRNRIRHDVMPVLEALHRGASRRISALAERLEQYPGEELLGLALVPLLDPAEPRRLCRQPLQRRSPACQELLLRHWLEQETGRSPASRTLLELCRSLRSSCEPGSLNLGGGWRLAWQAQHLLLLEPTVR